MSKSAFFIGIKGVGMCALAVAMQEAGWSVAGSDTDEVFITDDILTARHIQVDPLNTSVPSGTNVVIYSAAYDVTKLTSNISHLKSQSLAEALSEFVSERKVIAVAGVGGKTTTSAMLAALFKSAGRDVGYYVGTSTIAGLDSPGVSGTDPYFVVEADEYAVSKTDKRPKFALLKPTIVITTNIIHDHPDIYPDEGATLAVFTDLIKSIKPGGAWICNPADPVTAKILGDKSLKCRIMHYGADHPLYSKLNLNVFGDQNKLDATAAVLAAIEAGLTESQALEAIEAYRGAGRRQESHGEHKGRLLYDDYGHHPREIEVTLKSFKERYPDNRLLLVFESHTYSRTESLLAEFASAVNHADLAFIMPIFESAREKGQPHSVTTESFAALIPGATPLTWDTAVDVVWQASRPGDIILTMGAGVVYKLHEQFRLK